MGSNGNFYSFEWRAGDFSSCGFTCVVKKPQLLKIPVASHDVVRLNLNLDAFWKCYFRTTWRDGKPVIIQAASWLGIRKHYLSGITPANSNRSGPNLLTCTDQRIVRISKPNTGNGLNFFQAVTLFWGLKLPQPAKFMTGNVLAKYIFIHHIR